MISKEWSHGTIDYERLDPSEGNVDSKSLRKVKVKYNDKVKLRVRFSLSNLCLNKYILNSPLFMADQADRLIGIVI